ncbi:MAG: hypothetical protein KC505_09580 [Myxococcales bacterium]|nr:hypothetical protein [Myxococcales bacterium]USN50705.1 MAG: hypothetical protein H6731_10680 [Myxococcales bacterium]
MQTPKPASTLVCCSITTDWPHKILLLKRNERSAFLPGAYVFPGGRLDKNDQKLARWLESDKDGLDRIAQFFPAQHPVLEHLACAMRETLEESAISVAKATLNGQDFFLKPYELKDLLSNIEVPYQARLDHIWPISWWITPSGESRRFDTNFFLALLPQEQSAHCQGETKNPLWLSPNEALNSYEQHKLFLAPPTRSVLERMNSSKNIEEFISYIDSPLFPIEPYFIDQKDKKILVLPGDEMHHYKKKSRFIMKTRYQFP